MFLDLEMQEHAIGRECNNLKMQNQINFSSNLLLVYQMSTVHDANFIIDVFGYLCFVFEGLAAFGTAVAMRVCVAYHMSFQIMFISIAVLTIFYRTMMNST